ncbi:helix-turn-helix domain-containing protein [Dasania sp. GY-19]|uniref:Helix-turn-helix domain-containing protein n=1 Tax=Dasania phycosphaerae TaxID=2950436 RepID=A0A9J6RSK1_9GAMM|nr:helix-turn-helix domain-containing protein [Dasania phycosphaerae]MCZ0867152.1 helix-turn-helix domain-containing protein [Dasania phycosphaerae]
MDIDQLIQQPEGKQLEFKRDLSSPKPLLKTLVAFANTAGGQLIIGISDNGDIVGVDDPLTEEERLANLIADSITPRLVPSIEMVTVEAKTLLIIEVYLSNTRPHWLTALGLEQGVMVRLGSSTRQAGLELIADLQRSVSNQYFDEMPMPELGVDDVDIQAAQQLFADKKQLNQQALLSLKLLTQHQGKVVPTKGAVLLFGKQRSFHFNDAWIQCGRFIGIDRTNIFDHIELYDHLPQAADSILLFLKKHAMRGADFSEIRRKDVWNIPLGILREVVINALVHADYSQRGMPIRVAFYDDRIEVESPGLLLPGMTIEDMKRGTSMIRNPIIARVFRELDLIEQWGSGVKGMFNEAKELGLPEPVIEEIAMRVRVTVWLANAIPVPMPKKGARAQSGAQSGAQSDQPLQTQSLTICRMLEDAPLAANELLLLLGLNSKTGAFKRAIKELMEKSLIEYTIPDKPNSRLQKYRLTEQGLQSLKDNS